MAEPERSSPRARTPAPTSLGALLRAKLDNHEK